MCVCHQTCVFYQACKEHKGPVDDDTLKSILGQFMEKMESKWDSIGIQLRQGDFVADLRPELGNQKLQRIIEAWFLSPHKDVPVSVKTISRILKSDAVKMGAVAVKIEEVR